MKKYAVIMAGGTGTRFWPKSSAKNPKQLLSLTAKQSQMQLTFTRLQGLIDKKNRWAVSTEALQTQIKKQIPGITVLGEPEGRNTMAAVCWSAWTIFQQSPDSVVAILPADAFIKDVPKFNQTLKEAFDIATSEKKIVCLGIQPTFAATAYGYIQGGEPIKGEARNILKFIEKPDSDKAEELVASRDFYWNAGIFVFHVGTFIKEVQQLAPEFAKFFDGAKGSIKKIKAGYKKLPSVSVDVALMEKTSRGAVIPGSFGWNDLGSWPALAEVLKSNSPAGLVTAPGGHFQVDSKNNIIELTSKKFLGLVGVENLILVETKDAILVCHKEKAQQIKDLVGLISKNSKLKKKLL